MATNRPEEIRTFSASRGSKNDLPRFPEQTCALCRCAAKLHTVDYTGQRLLCPTEAEQEANQARYASAAELRTKELAARLERTMKEANAGRMTIAEAVKASKPLFETNEADRFRTRLFAGGLRPGKRAIYDRIVKTGKLSSDEEAAEKQKSAEYLRRSAAIEKIARAVGVSADEVVNKTGGIPTERLEDAIARFELEAAQKEQELRRQRELEQLRRQRPSNVPPMGMLVGSKSTVAAYKALAGADLEVAYFDEIGDYELEKQKPTPKKPTPEPAVSIGGKRRYFEE